MQDRLWKTITLTYQESDSSMMKHLMKMHLERGAAVIREYFPGMPTTSFFHIRPPRLPLEGTISACVYTDRSISKDNTFASIDCSAVPIRRDIGENRHLWKISCEDIIRGSEDSVRAYLCRNAVMTAIQLSPYMQDKDGGTPVLEHTERPEDVMFEKDDVLTASVSLPNGERLLITAQPYGEDAKRFMTLEQTQDIRRLVAQYPDLPIIIASSAHLPDDMICSLPCSLPDVSCYVHRVLDYDYLGNGTIIMSQEHLDQCLEWDLAEKYKGDKEGLERAIFAERERLEPYWRDAIVIEAGC